MSLHPLVTLIVLIGWILMSIPATVSADTGSCMDPNAWEESIVGEGHSVPNATAPPRHMPANRPREMLYADPG